MAWVQGEVNQDMHQISHIALNNYAAANAVGGLYFMRS